MIIAFFGNCFKKKTSSESIAFEIPGIIFSEILVGLVPVAIMALSNDTLLNFSY